jgi:hypothetical protein
MNRLRRLAASALVIGAACFSLPADASTIDWTLSGVTFDDGGTATGTFSTDSTSGDVIAFDIVTTPGTTLGGATYDSTASGIYSSNGVYSSNSFIVSNFNTFTYVNFEFVSPLTSPGTDDLILSIGTDYASYECNMCGTVRDIVSGEAVSGDNIGTTPLPTTIPLFATGLGAFGLFGWRKKRKSSGVVATS